MSRRKSRIPVKIIIMKKKNSPKFASSLFDCRPFPIPNLKLKELS
jgi:hypothetical protein